MSARASILIVEDDRDEVDVAVRAIRHAGLDAVVEVARDGQQALELLGLEPDPDVEAPLRPDVVFLDLKLPRVNGWEVLRRLRAYPPTAQLPVVVVSSSAELEDVRRSYALGANSVLVKQFDRHSPGRYFADAARYWSEINHPLPAGGDPR